MRLGCTLLYGEDDQLKLFIRTESLRTVPIWPSNKIPLMAFFLQTTVAVVPFSEVLPPKLRQFFQIHFAAVEGVCVLTILTL
jgi:hypothetical protein